jgi:hypothetical protein
MQGAVYRRHEGKSARGERIQIRGLRDYERNRSVRVKRCGQGDQPYIKIVQREGR